MRREVVEDRPHKDLAHRELRDAIRTEPRGSKRWNALVKEAVSRPDFPALWLPSEVSVMPDAFRTEAS